MTRKAAVAGSFYPSDKDELESIIRKLIANAEDSQIKNLKGVIAPHAGYVYSGPVAAFSYKQMINLPNEKYNVFLLGPAHFVHTTASIGMFESFETPLGTVKVNQLICENLLKNRIFDSTVDAHILEHSLEVQLPFLQKTLNNFEIIPILLGEIPPDSLTEILSQFFGKDGNIFVFSSDLSHYRPYAVANKIDLHTIKIITGKSIEQENEIDACGETGIKVAMRLAASAGCNIKLLNYRNSGDTAGNKDAVVGYASLAIF